jgi:S1-C subfamily serine protease
MMNISCVLAAVPILASTAVQAIEPRELFKIAEPSVVVILASDSRGGNNVQGSGVLLSPLEVVTSCKLVETAVDIVVAQESVLRVARRRFQDPERDLCQLHIEEPLPSAKVAMPAPLSTPPEVGQEVYLVGSPRGLERTLARTMVAGVRKASGSLEGLIQIDTQTAPGVYGGGLFDQEGRLLGILTPQFRQGDAEIWVVPAAWIAQLEKRSPDRMTTAQSTASPADPAATRIEAAQMPAWMPKPGDVWKYKHTYVKQVTGTVTVEVTKVSASSIRERVTYDRSRAFVQERDVEPGFNQRFQKLIALPGGYQLPDISPYLPPDSELQPGKRWSDIPGEFAIQGSPRKMIAEVRATGRERIRVPAGDFEALRIEALTERIYHNNLFFSVKSTFWYVPEIKRYAKAQIRTESSVAVHTNSEIYELISFTGTN